MNDMEQEFITEQQAMLLTVTREQEPEAKNSASIAGERGERGETPEKSSKADGRKAGESGRKRGEFEIKPDSIPYPVDALGDLSAVCKFIAVEGQVRPEIVGQSLLATVALCNQGVYKIETLSGFKPLSLNCLTLAESGEGKSTVEAVTLKKVYDKDREDFKEYQSQKNGEGKKDKAEDTDLIVPIRLCSDATTQGLIHSFKRGFPSQGLFTAEAATILCGWGMNQDNKLNTAAMFNNLFDGSPISITRAGEGRTQLYDRRLSCHLLIQPDAARQTLDDEALANIGLWPRFLIAYPEPLPPRQFKRFNYKENDEVKKYWNRIDALLAKDVVGYGDKCTSFKKIELTGEALEVMIAFFEEMEQSRCVTSADHIIKNFAARATEKACRIAGNLAVYRQCDQIGDNVEISMQDAKNGTELARYSLDVWRSLFTTRDQAEHYRWAKHLYDWLLTRPNQTADETAMLKVITPKTMRSRHKRDVALAILKELGRIANPEINPALGIYRSDPKTWEAIK